MDVILSQAPSFVSDIVIDSEKFLQGYSRLQILICSIVATFFLVKLREFYFNHDFSWPIIKGALFRYFIRLPIVRNIAQKQLDDVDRTVSKQCRELFSGKSFLHELPKKGLKRAELLAKFENYKHLSKINWKQGRVSGTIYTDFSGQLPEIVKEIYGETAYSNPLHPEIFPEINKMEAEIVRMVINLFNGDSSCCGTMTSGGTESIFLAIKAFRDYGLEVCGKSRPELLAPVTAHAAFQKSCQYLGIKFKPIAVNPKTFQLDIDAMRRAITKNTILLVGSGCSYPHGIIDDIQSIAKLGLKYNIPVHVDCCLAGFLIPFTKDAGFPIEPVDFSVSGITSISADTHKYGYAPKGSSVLMYSDKIYRNHQYSVQTDWPGGIYASSTIFGSRSGANIAVCWASLIHYGYEGYVEATKKILTVQNYMKKELSKIKGIYIMGDPKLSVIAISSSDFDVFRLKDCLTKKGWNINPLQFPSGFHICLTLMHCQEGVAKDFLRDIRESVSICMKDPTKKSEGAGVIYGMAQSIPDRSLVKNFAFQYLNSLYET